ncbi:regulatory protein RecX [Oceanospirillum sanctuarii]|uniref:regulatory protein RecX n=1 Tax=Oceanospirillum sanctuarii TaxID=1434821 RepID=UPI000A378D31|nr:regulatory protein RecX [Oceanospirillum sanctuarii]
MAKKLAETESELFQMAMEYLARRDHAEKELRQKLSTKLDKENPQSSEWLNVVVQKLQELGYQSDERYIEMLVRARTERGYGPQFIRQYLQQYQLDSLLIEEYIDPKDKAWNERALNQLEKKFRQPTRDFKIRQKQQRHLYQRGFSGDNIRWAQARFDEQGFLDEIDPDDADHGSFN